jgi:WD40 repeat protein
MALVVVVAIAGISTALAYALRRKSDALESLDAARVTIYSNRIARSQAALDGGNLVEAERQLDECPEDLRHWEHRYLTALAHRHRRLDAHSGGCWTVAFSPDGQLLATGGQTTGEVKLWEPASGRLLRTLAGPPGKVRALAFHPAGSQLATIISVAPLSKGPADEFVSVVQVWDVSVGREIFAEKSHGDRFAVAFRPDGRGLLVAGCKWPLPREEQQRRTADLLVREWDLSTQRPARDATLRVAPPAYKGRFSPNGDRLVFAVGETDDRKSYLVRWDFAAETNTPNSIAEQPDWILDIAFRPDGRQLAFVGTDVVRTLGAGGVFNWDRHYRGHSGGVLGVGYNAKGNLLASSGRDRSVRIWDVASGILVQRLVGHTDMVNCVAFSPDERRIASGSADGSVVLWDLAPENPAQLEDMPSLIYQIAFHPRGTLLAAASFDQKVRLIDATSGRIRHELGGHTLPIDGLAFSPDGRSLASAGRDRLILWDVSNAEQPPKKLWEAPGEGRGVAFHPDGRRLVALLSVGDGAVIRDVTRGEVVRRVPGAGVLAFHPDGQRLVTVSNGRLILWDLGADKQVRTFEGLEQDLYGVAFSPDGTLLATGGGTFVRERFSGTLKPGELKVWETGTGRLVHDLRGHSGIVRDVAFSPDGKRLVSAGHEGIVKIWELVHGQQVLSLDENRSEVYRAAFSPDGSILASGGGPTFDSRMGELILRYATTGTRRATP